MEDKKRQILTFTNIIIICTTIVYILNIFMISPDTGSAALKTIDTIKKQGEILNQDHILTAKLFGVWGGHVNDFLGDDIKAALSGEIWRFFTDVLTHTFIAHFITNMIALYVAGNHIEKKYGTLKTIGLFLILSVLQKLITGLIYFKVLGYPYSITYGASGWITCLIGMILGKCLMEKNYYKKELSKLERIILIIYFITFTFVVMPNAFTITAHVSGLVIGLLTEIIIHKTKATQPT